MAKHAEVVKYEAAVAKAAAVWAAEVNKHVAQFDAGTNASAASLRRKVQALETPKGAPDKEFTALADRINEIIAKEESNPKITLRLFVEVDAKAKSLTISGMTLGIPQMK